MMFARPQRKVVPSSPPFPFIVLFFRRNKEKRSGSCVYIRTYVTSSTSPVSVASSLILFSILFYQGWKTGDVGGAYA